MVQNDANIEAEDIFSRRPLHSALLSESKEIVKFLLEKKVNIESKDMHGMSPVEHAFANCSAEIGSIFMEKDCEKAINGIHKEECMKTYL